MRRIQDLEVALRHPIVEMSQLVTSASRSPSAGVLISPTGPMFPKKRSRLTNSGSFVAVTGEQVRSVSPSRSTRGESGGGEAPTPTGSAPSASPILSTPEDRTRATLNSKSPVMIPTAGITPISPPSSSDSPGNLQIFIPVSEIPFFDRKFLLRRMVLSFLLIFNQPEDEQSAHNDGRYSSSLSRQTSNSKSSLSGNGTADITSPPLANESATSPRHNLLSIAPATSPSHQQQQKTPQSP